MKLLKCTILETNLGWLNKERGIYHKTAVAALRYVKRTARDIARNGPTCINVIDWETTTPAGRAIVRTITTP